MPSPLKPTTSAPAKPTPPATGINLPIYGKSLFDYIFERSKQLGLDPYAVESVVPHEGGYQGAIGDQGSSFGPFQLHVNGRLPSEIAAKGSAFSASWANSPTGLDYALNGIRAAVPSGTSGYQAIEAQVTDFEQPAKKNLPGEIAASKSSYDTLKAQSDLSGSDPGHAITSFLGGATQAGLNADMTVLNAANDAAKHIPGVAQVEDLFSGIGDFSKWASDPNNWLRVGEVIAGGILATIGLIMFGRSLIAPSSSPTGQLRGSASTVAGAAAAPARARSSRSASRGRSEARAASQAASAQLQADRLAVSRARVSKGRADARSARSGATEAKRRSERARGITSSEIAGLQMGRGK